MVRAFYLAFLAAVILVLMQALPAAAEGEGGKPMGKPLAVEEGKEFSITLESKEAAGFRWFLWSPLNEKIVKLVSSHPEKGAGGREIWTFRAVGRGETSIHLKYVRARQDTPGEDSTATFVVFVEASEKPLQAEAGKEFTITVPSNETTGYKWELDGPLDEKLVTFVKSEYLEPRDPKPGAGGSEAWTFRAQRKGLVSISLKYVRPWEKNKPPAKQKTFTIQIR
ncbi:MAG: protease inhibitor I42 family protein [Candidatus Eremiobacteraeota bacterium]|nr:protease inhibitor I42 family protein [Candidatus Eremiobacteraeota bacterium]